MRWPAGRTPCTRLRGLHRAVRSLLAAILKAFHASSLLHFLGRLLDRCDDVRIRSAPTQVATHIFTYLVCSSRVPFFHTGNRRHDLAWRAVATLKSVVIDERLLHGMQLCAGLRQSL